MNFKVMKVLKKKKIYKKFYLNFCDKRIIKNYKIKLI